MTKDSSGSAETVEREVASELTPNATLVKRLSEVCSELVQEAEEKAKALKLPMVRAVVAGSAGRGTFLPPTFDIDLFVLFDTRLKREDLVADGLKLGAEILGKSATKKYAEHPYLRGEYKGFATEVVPGYSVKSGAEPMTAVDRTPFHHEYLMARHDDRSRSEVRLTKKFMRAIGVYGAEVRTEGFSGYLTELLVLRAGSFRGLLKEASSWSLPMRLSPPGNEPSAEATASLILADPVDPHRNVAAAVSRRNLATFVLASQAYFSGPSRRFFFPEEAKSMTLESAMETMRERETIVIVVSFPVPPMVPDVIYPQVRKTERSIGEHLRDSGFHVVGTSFGIGESRAVIAVETSWPQLGLVHLHQGPPVGVPDTAHFIEKWKHAEGTMQGPYVTPEGRLVVEIREQMRDVKEVARASLPKLSVGKDLRDALAKEASVERLDEALLTLKTQTNTDEGLALMTALCGLWHKRLTWDEPGH